MKCPHCRTTDLKPTMIEEYLPGMGCETCHGSLVSLLYYRHWAETQKAPAPDPGASTAVETTDTTTAITCPKCERVMSKYKLTGRVSNRLDVCSTCDDAWLDGGEWQLLETLQLSLKLPAIFTDTWQRRVRHEITEETRRGILTRMVGEDGAVKVDAFKEWLAKKSAEQKSHVMAYLYRN